MYNFIFWPGVLQGALIQPNKPLGSWDNHFQHRMQSGSIVVKYEQNRLVGRIWTPPLSFFTDDNVSYSLLHFIYLDNNFVSVTILEWY